MFRRTCFGMFLDVGELSVSGQLMHQLLLRQVESNDVDFGDIGARLNFIFSNRTTSFGITDFALITGLVCRDVPDISSLVDTGVHRLRELWFEGDKANQRYNLELCFQRLCRRKKEKQVDEEVVKLALIYFLEFVLVAKERHRPIDNQWLQLVDNLDAFNNFPWGTVSYQRTIASLAGIMVNRVQNRRKRPTKKEQYCIFGFPMALQIWSYEVVPVIGSTYASKVRDMIPRILNWNSYQTPNAKELLENVFQQSKLQVHTMIAANEVEMEQEYWINVRDRVVERSMQEDTESASDSSESASDSSDDTAPVEQSSDAHGHTEHVEQSINADVPDDVNAMLEDLKKHINDGSLISERKSEFLYTMTVVNRCLQDALLAMKFFFYGSEVVKSPVRVLVADVGVQTEEDDVEVDVVGGGNGGAPDSVAAVGVMTDAVTVEGGVNVSVTDVGVMTDADEAKGDVVGGSNLEGGVDVKAEELVVDNADNVDATEVENVEMVDEGNDGSIVEGEEGEAESPVDGVEEQRDPDFLHTSLCSMASFSPPGQSGDFSGVEVVTPSKFPRAEEGGIKPYVMNKQKRALKPGPLTRTPFTSPSFKKRKTVDPNAKDVLGQDSSEDVKKLDLKKKYPDQWASDMVSFMKDRSKDGETLSWPIFAVNKQWFMDAVKLDGWLSDQHLDVAMYLIRKRMKKFPESFKRDCVVLDCLFFTRVQEKFQMFQKNPDETSSWDEDSIFLDYVVGLLPIDSVAWSGAKFIYFPANFDNKHWVAVELVIEKKTIQVYDSLPSITSVSALKDLFDPLMKMLPYLLHSTGLGDGLFAPWRLQRIPQCPRQAGSGDCGMFAIKFIEALTADLPIGIIDQIDMKFYRQKFCTEAWGQEFIL